MDKLTCMRLFTQVARLGSFTAVANELNMTQSAVSKKIAWLENELGFTLFHRTSRQISLTQSGKSYLDYSVALLEQMTVTEHRLKHELSEVVGELKLSAPSAFAAQQLAHPIALFKQQHPNVTFNISVSDKQVDLYESAVDIALRVAHLKDSRLKAKKLCDHTLCYFASPAYLAKKGEPHHPSDLTEHDCITYSLTNPAHIWHFGEHKYEVNQAMTSDSPELIVALAISGLGIAAMPRWMVEDAFAKGQLTELFSAQPAQSLPMYAVYKNEEYLPYRIRVFIDFLSAYFDER